MSESAILTRVSRAYRLTLAPCFDAARDVKARLGYEVAEWDDDFMEDE